MKLFWSICFLFKNYFSVLYIYRPENLVSKWLVSRQVTLHCQVFYWEKITAAPQQLVTPHRQTLNKYEDSMSRSSVLLQEGLVVQCFLFRSDYFGALSLVIPSFLLMKNMNGEKWLLNILNINQYLIVSWAVDFNLQIKYWFFAIWKEKWKSLKYATLFGPNIGTFQNKHPKKLMIHKLWITRDS